MFADINKPPAPLPQPQLVQGPPGIKLLPPLTRTQKTGPGIIVIVPDDAPSTQIEKGVPSLSMKWAEEGYTVAELQASYVKKNGPNSWLEEATTSLKNCSSCSAADKLGVVVYEPSSWQAIAGLKQDSANLVGAIVYTDGNNVDLSQSPVPVLQHIAGKAPSSPSKPSDKVKNYYYPNATSPNFATPFTKEFHYITEAISHTRNLTFLKPKIGGPYFDLEFIWDEHCYYEFADRSVEHTMSTMVQEPYVNHVPTLTGGVGRAPLSQFYRDDFIFSNSSDAELELISRTVGIDRIVDEFIFKCTHDQEIPWMLPSVPPTGKYIQTPFTAVVNIRGDRLYHEHIAWDQASILMQLNLLPEYLPFPYPVKGAEGKQVEYRLPVGGNEVAAKMRDRHALESNHMMDFKVRITDVEHKTNGVNGVNGVNGTNGVTHVNGKTSSKVAIRSGDSTYSSE